MSATMPKTIPRISTDRFVTLVEECLGGGVPPGWLAADEAARTVHVVLEALALRLSPRDRRRMAAELPRPLNHDLERLDFDSGPPASDTIGRVARELGLDREIAARRIGCVLHTLRLALGAETAAALPEEPIFSGAQDHH